MAMIQDVDSPTLKPWNGRLVSALQGLSVILRGDSEEGAFLLCFLLVPPLHTLHLVDSFSFAFVNSIEIILLLEYLQVSLWYFSPVLVM